MPRYSRALHFREGWDGRKRFFAWRLASHVASLGLSLLDVMVHDKPATLRELGAGVGYVAREQQQISRLYLPSESHEDQGVQGQGWKLYGRKISQTRRRSTMRMIADRFSRGETCRSWNEWNAVETYVSTVSLFENRDLTWKVSLSLSLLRMQRPLVSHTSGSENFPEQIIARQRSPGGRFGRDYDLLARLLFRGRFVHVGPVCVARRSLRSERSFAALEQKLFYGLSTIRPALPLLIAHLSSHGRDTWSLRDEGWILRKVHR